jgi:chromate transporter
MTDLSLPLEAEPRPPTVGQIFFGFLQLGLMGFGGVLPIAHDLLVERRRWLSQDEFTDLLGLCQFLPGGNVINMSAAVGMRFRGWPGAVAGITGLIAAPTVIVLVLGAIYARYQDVAFVMHAVGGIAAAAAGLLCAMAVKMLRPLLKRKLPLSVVAVCFVAIAVMRWPLLTVMLTLAPLSVLVHARLRA